MEEEKKTRSEIAAADIGALLRARNSVICVPTREEGRVEGYLIEAAASANYIPYTWDAAQGVADIGGKKVTFGSPDPGEMLTTIRERAEKGSERNVWIMRDLSPWLIGPGGLVTTRQLRNLVRILPGVPREQAQAVIILSPSGTLPPELSGQATMVEWPMPDREEIADILDRVISNQPDDIKATAAVNGVRDAAIDAAVGLSGKEAEDSYAKSIVLWRCIDATVVAQEKRRAIAREKLLEWYEPIPDGLKAVGGLDELKKWLLSRGMAYTAKARTYGVPIPRGILVVGISGCGKTLISKCIATAWNEPLIRMDLGAGKSKFLGESEGNLRQGIRVIEAVGRCVVWLDEIEKVFQGATSGAADGGVAADALATVLTWMQERTSEAFVIATANDVSQLPPELLRKGRFDEIWWVDLPNATEREAILAAALRKHNRGGVKIDLTKVAIASEGFTGSEIAELVPDALYTAFADDAREINTNDLIAAASKTVPLSKTASEKIEAMRTWAKGRARPATSGEPRGKLQPRQGRSLDI